MLFFSPLFISITNLLHMNLWHTKQTSYPLHQLLHLPYKLGPITNAISVYEWFYNIYFKQNSHPPSKSTLFFTPRNCNQPTLSLHHLLFLIYVFSNLGLTYPHEYNSFSIYLYHSNNSNKCSFLQSISSTKYSNLHNTTPHSKHTNPKTAAHRVR